MPTTTKVIRKLDLHRLDYREAVDRICSILPDLAYALRWIYGTGRQPFGAYTMAAAEKPAVLRRWFAGLDDMTPDGRVHDRMKEVFAEKFGDNIKERVRLVEARYGKYMG